MKAVLLNPTLQEASQLIVFFTGWAMNSDAVAHLAFPENTHILHMEDYRTPYLTLPIDLTRYSKITYIAWSMGVWGAERAVAKGVLPQPKEAIALAGTPFPYHDEWGIPKLWFEKTLSELTPDNRQRFFRRMAGGKRLSSLFAALEQRDLEEIRTELDTVLRYEQTHRPLCDSLTLHWTHAVIPSKDRIFPAQNLLSVWQACSTPTTVLADADHYIFDKYYSWQQLLDEGRKQTL